MFFSYDGDGGFDTHNTEKEAKEEAEYWLHEHSCDDYWPEAADRVCWGEVRGTVVSMDMGPMQDREEVQHVEMQLESHPSPLDLVAYHACVTGDCDHDQANDCLTEIIGEIKKGQEDARTS